MDSCNDFRHFGVERCSLRDKELSTVLARNMKRNVNGASNKLGYITLKSSYP